MKAVFFLICMGCTVVANAQFNKAISNSELCDLRLTSVNNYFNELNADVQRIPGERMRNTGIALIVGGVIMEGVGIGLLSSVENLSLGFGSISYQSNNPNDEDELPTRAVVGLLGVAGGIGMLVPGVIFASKGGKRYNNYMKEHKQISLNVKGNGVSLSLRF